ncbi:hypothetical protein MMC14_009351 [Varicellaria rhodocarpa]|nr:hypothetical protein [Varicellaria rhodocarpa]
MTAPTSDPFRSTSYKANPTKTTSLTSIFTSAFITSNDPLAPSIADPDSQLDTTTITTRRPSIQSTAELSDTTIQSLETSETIVGGQTVKILSATRVEIIPMGSSKLVPEGPIITISALSVSIGSDEKLIGTSTATLSNGITKITIPHAQPSVLVVEGQNVITISQGATAVGVGSVTLDAQRPAATISGTPISLGSDALIIGTSIIALPSEPTYSNGSPLSEFTVGTITFTINSEGVAVGNTELFIGGSPVTIDGIRISLGFSDFVFGSEPETAPIISTSSTTNGEGIGREGIGLAGFIMSGLGEIGGGPVAIPTTSASVEGNTSVYVTFLGSAPRVSHGSLSWLVVMLGMGL